ncbi:glycosyltransferase family 2 protein [Collinsella bouchesdurhonensis]|uniref:glycosyltransferase family 2 protein n=1 Tax=Collinsella bouchesdurhonensis TaxID=1907654 RepID=UPI003F8A6EF0
MVFCPTDHTFVLCAYKESPFLEECLQSLLAQTIRTNVLIATSTPCDATRELAKRYSVKLHVRDGTPGIADDWNYAVSCAGTSLVTIAHQDDTYEPEYAARLLSAANKVDNLLIFFTNYGELRSGKNVDDNQLLRVKRMLLSLIKDGKHSSSCWLRRRVLSVGSPVCCPSVTLNMANLPTVPFKTTFKCDLDWDAWERYSKLDGDFYYDSKVLMHHRIHEESETTALIKDDTRTMEDFSMLCRFWPRPVARLVNLLYGKSQASNDLKEAE